MGVPFLFKQASDYHKTIIVKMMHRMGQISKLGQWPRPFGRLMKQKHVMKTYRWLGVS
jgi:hypothetical protein